MLEGGIRSETNIPIPYKNATQRLWQGANSDHSCNPEFGKLAISLMNPSPLGTRLDVKWRGEGGGATGYLNSPDISGSLCCPSFPAVVRRFLLFLDFLLVMVTAITITTTAEPAAANPPQSPPFCTSGIDGVLGVRFGTNTGGSGSTLSSWSVGGISDVDLVGESP